MTPSSPDDPYSAPGVEVEHSPLQSGAGFLKGWTIADLVFCSFKFVFIPFSIIGAFTIKPGNVLKPTVSLEIISQTGILIFGVTGNILLLLKKRMGLPIAIVATLFTALHILNSAYQLQLTLQQVSDHQRASFMMVGAGSMFLFRFALNGIYIFVLSRYWKNNILQ